MDPEKRYEALLLVFSVVLPAAEGNPAMPGATVLPLLPPGPGNPRNTEGSFVALRGGRILFAYSHFTGGGGDNDAASVVGRFSSDGGRTWTPTDAPIVAREGDMNVMSVSLLRLKDGRIASSTCERIRSAIAARTCATRATKPKHGASRSSAFATTATSCSITTAR